MDIRKKILEISGILAALSIFFTTGFALGTQRAASRVSAVPDSASNVESTAVSSEDTSPEEPSFEASTVIITADTQPESQESASTETTEVSEEKKTYPITSIPANAGETVELFNAAANRIKSEKPAVYMTKDYFQISNALFGKTDITQTLSKLNRNDQSKKEILPVEFPVGGENWSSHLQLGAVESAECIDAGNTLQIKIVLKPESGVPLRAKSNHGSCFSIPANFDFLNVDISGIKIGELTLTYSGCSISCSIDKSTGQLIRADYHIQAHGALQLTLAAIVKKDCSAQIVSDTSFEINWD